jgi:DNA replication protein DnaC
MAGPPARPRDGHRATSEARRAAALCQAAPAGAVEDIDYRAARGLDRALFQRLVEAGDWIDAHDNLVICGPTGVGKSWLACALGHKACRDNRSVLYQRVPKLFAELALARGDGRHPATCALGGVQLLILDDWGLEPLDAAGPPRSPGNPRGPLRPTLHHRHQPAPVDRLARLIGDPTYADAILDRLVHNAHRLDLTGESLRRCHPATLSRYIPGYRLRTCDSPAHLTRRPRQSG